MIYVCGGALQGVVVQDDGVEVGQLAVAGGDGGHLVAREVQTHQGQHRQLYTHGTHTLQTCYTHPWYTHITVVIHTFFNISYTWYTDIAKMLYTHTRYDYCTL